MDDSRLRASGEIGSDYCSVGGAIYQGESSPTPASPFNRIPRCRFIRWGDVGGRVFEAVDEVGADPGSGVVGEVFAVDLTWGFPVAGFPINVRAAVADDN